MRILERLEKEGDNYDFSLLEQEASVSFSDQMCPLSVVVFVVFVNFSTSSKEPTGQFLQNLAQSIHGCRGTKFYSSEGLHPLSRGSNKELWEISWHLNFFSINIWPKI